MSDLISRDAAIEAIEEVHWYHIYDGRLLSGANSDMHQALYKAEDVYKALDNVPSALRWIPVSERLPEKNDTVIVTVLDELGDTSFRYTTNGYYLSDGIWIVDGDPMGDGALVRPIAWMPLPEPWKGEEK